MANREICDVKHPSIKDADDLWIFCHKENRFKVFSRTDYPKPKGSICQLCPNGMRRTNDLVIFCQTKVETWSTLKSHLVTIERIYGELVAFPLDMREEDLPPVLNYGHKYRAYGQLADYQAKEEIYVFDVARGKFITAKRNMLSKMYTKYGCCNYCPCPRKVQSPSSILQHIQSIENRFFCYLILDNEGQNDRRNQEKIQIFVNSIKSGEQYARLQEQFQEIKQNRLSPDCGRYYNQSEDEHLSLNEENLDLSKVPIKKEETDYCNEFQDNQTVYETIYENEPRTEEERKAQEEAMKQEAEEARQDDKVLKGESVEIKMPRTDGDQKTDSDQAATGKKVELPFEFKYILKYTEKDDLERVKKCIERYPHSIDARDSDGYMPIHRACHNDNVELVKFLVDNGADVEAKTNEGWRPIHCAAYWGNIEVVSFLIKFGANINALTHGNNTCLHFAVQRYERKLLELLIYHPLMYLEVKNGSNDDAYELCKRKTENYELFHNLLNEDAY